MFFNKSITKNDLENLNKYNYNYTIIDKLYDILFLHREGKNNYAIIILNKYSKLVNTIKNNDVRLLIDFKNNKLKFNFEDNYFDEINQETRNLSLNRILRKKKYIWNININLYGINILKKLEKLDMQEFSYNLRY